MRRGLSGATRVVEVFETRGEFRAIEAGLSMLRGGDLILVQADQVEPSLAFIEQFIATNSGGDNGIACTCDTDSSNSMAAGSLGASNGQAGIDRASRELTSSATSAPVPVNGLAEK
jgi:hypothetical protein